MEAYRDAQYKAIMSAFIFRHAGIKWTEVADMLDKLASISSPNRDLEAAYYKIAEQVRQLPEDVPLKDVKIFDEYPKAK